MGEISEKMNKCVTQLHSINEFVQMNSENAQTIFTAPSIKYCNTFESAIELVLFEIAKKS